MEEKAKVKKKRVRKYNNTNKKILLREYRESISLTQSELGKLVGVDARTISAYELGTRKPSMKIAIKLTRVFNAKLDEIFPVAE